MKTDRRFTQLTKLSSVVERNCKFSMGNILREKKMKCKAILATAAMAASFGATSAHALLFSATGTGPGGVSVAATADFTISSNLLTIILTNTSLSNSGLDVGGSTLSGLYFNLTGNPELTPLSALLTAGSSIIQGNTCATGAPPVGTSCTGVTDVGGEFGYQAASGLPGGADRGISSSGYLNTGLAGNIGNFNSGAAGTNLDNPVSLDGINFGIVSSAAGFNPNGGLESEPLIMNSVTFLLSGVNGLTTADISNVSFQYGTSLTELNVPGCVGNCGPDITVPEPASLVLMGAGLMGFCFARRRKSV